MFRKFLIVLSVLLVALPLFHVNRAYAVENVSLFTPYTGLSATPGDTINYSVDVINSGTSIQNMSFTFENLPEGWETSIAAGGRDIRELSVRGDSEETLNIDVTVPLDANMADYRFSLVANDGNSKSTLPLLVTVTEQGSFETELTTDQANLQGHAESSFDYKITLRNRTADQQNYALASSTASGWGVNFQSGSDSISSITLEPNESKDITVKVTPPQNVEAGTYEIPITASTKSTTADLTLEAVITGSYGIELTTPTGALSTDITAGDDKVIDLVVTNTGTATLTDVNLRGNTPPNWESEFDQSTISKIEPGDSVTVKATLTAPKDAIAGDYVTEFTASSAETSADATFRISVEASTLWGIVAVLIIIGVVAGLYFIIRKYGRR